MCLNLQNRDVRKSDGTKINITTRCHKCWQCLRDRKYDLIGRAMAEHLTSKWTLVGTLTYGNDDHYSASEGNLRAKVLHYEDVQTWLKAMRNELRRLDRDNGETVKSELRYIACGEYGTAKGRAHFHAVLFGNGHQPRNIVAGKNYMHSWKHQYAPLQSVPTGTAGLLWPHGWTFWRDISADEGSVLAGVSYVLKYALKDQYGDTSNPASSQRLFHHSKYPILGHEYLRGLARRAVDAYLPLHAGGVDIDTVKGVELSPAADDVFCGEYVRYWRERHGNMPWPEGKPDMNNRGRVQKYLDRRLPPADHDLSFRLQRGRLEAAQAVRKGRKPPPFMAVSDDRIRTDFLATFARHHRFDDDAGDGAAPEPRDGAEFGGIA